MKEKYIIHKYVLFHMFFRRMWIFTLKNIVTKCVMFSSKYKPDKKAVHSTKYYLWNVILFQTFFSTWYPFDVTSSSIFAIFFPYTIFHVFVGFSFVSIGDAYFIVSLIHIRSQLRILNLKLKSLRPIYETKYELKNKQTVIKSDHLQAMVFVNIERRQRKIRKYKQVYPSHAQSTQKTIGVSKKENKFLLSKLKLESDKKMARRLLYCVKQHQRIIR